MLDGQFKIEYEFCKLEGNIHPENRFQLNFFIENPLKESK